MSFKIGSVYRINNRYIEIIHNKDIFSKPVSSGKGLSLVGMLNSYVIIPLYNNQQAVGTIFEQIEPTKEREPLFSSKEEFVISKIRLIGTFSPLKNKFKKGIDFYPTLNADVFTIEENQLEVIYNSTIKEDKPVLNLGADIYFPTVKVNADPNILFGKHCAVFGNTGSGKSCTVTSILQGIYCNNGRLKNANNTKLKTIIIDSNEEYSRIFDLGNPAVTPDWVEVKDYASLELSHKDLNFYELTELLKEDSLNVTAYLRDAVCALKNSKNVDDKIYYEFAHLETAIVQAVPQIPDRNNRMIDDTFTIGFLKHVIKRIKNYSTDERMAAIFTKAGNSIETFLNSDKKVLILSLRVSNDILSLMSYMICKSIYNYKANPVNREKDNVLLVLEEAHRYISTTSNDQINNYYVEKVAREGRKFGINLMVSTQRPSEVSNTVISQCNSLIVHKITNNKDLEFIRNTIEYDDKSQIDLLTSLKQQEALVLGEAFSFSSLIKISDANPLPYSETPNIFE